MRIFISARRNDVATVAANRQPLYELVLLVDVEGHRVHLRDHFKLPVKTGDVTVLGNAHDDRDVDGDVKAADLEGLVRSQEVPDVVDVVVRLVDFRWRSNLTLGCVEMAPVKMNKRKISIIWVTIRMNIEG